jgi:hypothetical protein
MRRILVFTLMALTLGSGVALADRDNHRRGDNRSEYRGGDRHDRGIRNPRDPDWHQRDRYQRDRHQRDRYQRDRYQRDHRVIHRRPVHVNNGYYQFHNGYRYRYSRPVIRQRYFDYRVRPQIIVENYQPVAGYVWVPGQWQWNGYEWIWISGHYMVDPDIRY